MEKDNFSSQDELPAVGAPALSARELAAPRLPFLLRAWWLREFEDRPGFFWPATGTMTGALWSTHSDPICDAAGIDQPELL